MWRVFCTLALFTLLLTGCVTARAGWPGGVVKWTNGHCYEAVLAPGVSWDQAQAQCVARGGHLATITSAEENAFVFSLVSGNPSFWFLDGYGNGLGAWLGGYQMSGSAGPAVGWRWVTNEPFDYTNWETGQPGDMEGLEQNRLRFFKAGGLIGSRWDDCEANNPLAHRLGYIFECEPEISGHVEDGYDHILGGIEVTLIDVSSGSQTTAAVTITDDEGEYSFGGIGTGDYQIEIALECHRTVGDTAILSVNYDTAGPVVSAQTPSFQHTAGTSTTRDISFADPDLVPAAGITQGRLDDLAGMYYRTKQAVDFGQSELGVTLDLNLPIEVFGYVSSTPAKAYYDPNDGNVYIGVDRSDYDSWGKPWAPDWHEMFHQLMDDTVGIPPLHTGETGHGGYANHCTGDSWVEGWAEFWPCALARSLGVPEWYLFWGTTSLEQNWMVWDKSGGTSREEFAVASLLIDLVDPVNPAEYDFLSLTDSQLWAVIGSKQLADMFEVYSALVAANIGQADYDADGISDLDELFIAHGFFADDGNGSYDGETVGLGGTPGRQSTLLIPNAYLRIIVEDSHGNPISDGTLLVDVVFASPLDIYNYSYQVDLHSSDSPEYFEVAPDRCDAQMTMRVKDGDGTLSDEFTLSNSEYWQKVDESTTGYAAEHTFVLAAENVVPVAADNSYSVAEDTTLNDVAPGVLGNDTDANLDPLTATLVNPVSHGVLVINADGSFTYTPAANFNGTDSFTYKVNDGLADSSPATVTITVTPVNDLPVATADAYEALAGIALNVSAPGLLGNDSDIDDDTLTAVLVSSVSHGTLTLNADGSFTYTAESGFAGTDSFSYKANDGTGDSAAATVTIKVTLPEPPTIASVSESSGRLGNSLTVTITGTNLVEFTDLDFGAGIKVISVIADSSTHMTAEISIDSDAAPGTRDVIVTTPEGAFTLEDAFTVEGAKSGGVPVWIWPVLAVAVIAAGAGGFLLFRRRVKPG